MSGGNNSGGAPGAQQPQGGRVAAASDPAEVLIFRDYSGWEEPALSTPFGFWSLRNLAVLAVFVCLAGVLYSVVVPESMSIERDWVLVSVALSPLALGIMLASLNTPFGTSDTIIIALLMVVISNLGSASAAGKKKQEKVVRGRSRKKSKSEVLGWARHLEQIKPDAESDSEPLEITCADLDELKSIRVTIYGGDGYAYGNRTVRCYLDDELIEVMRTTTDGSLVLHVRPERAGSRMLTVRTDDVPEEQSVILLGKPLCFVRRGSGAGSSSSSVAPVSGGGAATDDNAAGGAEDYAEADDYEYDDDDADDNYANDRRAGRAGS